MFTNTFFAQRFSLCYLLMVALLVYSCTTDTPATMSSEAEDSTIAPARALIAERLGDFRNKQKTVGFAGSTIPTWDYVPGLVAKGALEWLAQNEAPEAKEALKLYGSCYANVEPMTTATTLDELNPAKIYPLLYDMAVAERDEKGKALYTQAMIQTAKALANYDFNYSIKTPLAKGGWYHKGLSYVNQMWCDGQYMGPALLAQLLVYSKKEPSIATALGQLAGDKGWQVIALQIDTTWHYLWDADKELLWHAMSSDGMSSSADKWVVKGTHHSQEYWSRAEGWYFLALCDIAEYAQLYGVPNLTEACKTKIEKIAAGLAKRQDTTGCWYQLLQYDGSLTVNGTSNYLESSGTCLFTAAYLKALRLGYLDKATYRPVADKAWQGIMTQFVKDGQLISSCESAGLSAPRLGDADYYLNGKDAQINNMTEGKVFGAFIMAFNEKTK